MTKHPKTLEYQGYNDLRLHEDGSFVSPASAGDPDGVIAVWTASGYRVSQAEIDRAPWVVARLDGINRVRAEVK